MAEVRRNLQKGMQEVQEALGSKFEKHLKTKQLSLTAMAVASVPHIFMVVFSVFIAWTARPGTSLFSWHPTLMCLSFMILMAEALLVFSPWFSPMMRSPRSEKTRWHWVLQACAMCCAYTGLTIISYNKYINKALHYSTWHGFTGIIVCCLLAIQASGGVLAMYPEVLPFKVKRAFIKLMHAFSGTFFTFAGAMLTVSLALYSSWFTANIQNHVVWCLCLSCPIIVVCAVSAQFIRNYVLLLFRKH